MGQVHGAGNKQSSIQACFLMASAGSVQDQCVPCLTVWVQVRAGEDPHHCGLVLEWVYGSIVSTAEKVRSKHLCLVHQCPQLSARAQGCWYENLVTLGTVLGLGQRRVRSALQMEIQHDNSEHVILFCSCAGTRWGPPQPGVLHPQCRRLPSLPDACAGGAGHLGVKAQAGV
jgi:hypothetical protein